MTTVLTGYYGAFNTGDDAFCEVAAWGVTKLLKQAKPLFFARSLPIINTPADVFYPYDGYLSFARAVSFILRSSYFISAGGSTFHSSLSLTDPRTYAKLKKDLHVAGKTAAIGISLGPYKDSAAEKSTINYLRSLDYLALRDARSFEIASSYDLPRPPVLAFDLAALLPAIYGDKTQCCVLQQPEKVVGVAACYYERYSGGSLEQEEERFTFLKDSLVQLKKDYSGPLRFRLFIFNGHPEFGDEEITRRLAHAIGGESIEIIKYSPVVRETYRLVQECDVMVSIRLHAAVFACFAQTAFFLLEYHQKCTDFLDDVGFQAYRLANGEAGVSEFSRHLAGSLNGEYSAPTGITGAREAAMLNFEFS
ncbi:polysaccharide pyruvyl transferase family protein [Luteimonas sp. A537]